MNSETLNAFETAVGCGAALTANHIATSFDNVPSIPYVVVPDNYKVEDLESLFDTPYRPKGTIPYRDMASFCRAVEAQKGDSYPRTCIYGNLLTPSFYAVFNDTVDSSPGWRDHRAIYDCPLSVEWKLWLGANKKVMSQETFAQFIEDNAPDCVKPDAATMIEIARTLEAKKKVNFASGIRLSNGQNELTYEEEITGTASKGKIPLPELFTIGISVLEGGPKYAVTARLRYRIADKGQLTIWYDLERPHKVLEDAAKQVWEAIEKATGHQIYNGG